MTSRKKLGKKGEIIARKYLEDNEYKIQDINYNTNFGEIDIIARYQEFIVFIEVKTRSSDLYGPPQSAVTSKKQKKIKKIASYYLARNSIHKTKIRFDVIAIIIKKHKKVLNHLINAF